MWIYVSGHVHTQAILCYEMTQDRCSEVIVALKLSNQIPNTDCLASFGFATLRMLMGLEFLNLIGQANLTSSYIVTRDKFPPSSDILTSCNLKARLLIDSMDKKNQLDVTFVFFISLLIVAQHVSGNHVPIIRS